MIHPQGTDISADLKSDSWTVLAKMTKLKIANWEKATDRNSKEGHADVAKTRQRCPEETAM